jgi:Xaa-Pro aminopeptidase
MPLLVAALLAAALLAAEPAPVPAPVPAPAGPAEHAARRERLRASLGDGTTAVILAARDADPFRQDRDFLYLTGLDTPGAALVLEGGKTDSPETLYLRPRDRAEERWTGEQPGPGDIDLKTGEPDAERQGTIARTGIAAAAAFDRLDAALIRAVKRGRALWLPVEPIERREDPPPGHALWRDLVTRAPGLVPKPLRPKLDALRAIKSEAEMAAIEQAVAITLEAQREAAARIAPGMHEYEARAVIEYVFTRAGARVAFPSIVGSGPNSTVLHYPADRRRMQEGDLVVVDIGAEWDGYAGDVSRTYPLSGRFSAEQREVYEVVLRAQDAALARVKPGAKLRSDVHAAAVKVIEDAGYKGFFNHGTSHYVGLDVHDVGERDGVLVPGMVITVEPGVYLPGKGFGVRIEDMVVVTADGYRLLTAQLPRKPEEIEALMAARAAAALP